MALTLAVYHKSLLLHITWTYLRCMTHTFQKMALDGSHLRLQRKLQFNFFFFTAQKSIFAVAAVNDQVIRGQKLYHLYNSINGLKLIARLFLHTQCVKEI